MDCYYYPRGAAHLSLSILSSILPGLLSHVLNAARGPFIVVYLSSIL